MTLILIGGLSIGCQWLLFYVWRRFTRKVQPDQPLGQLMVSGLQWVYRLASFVLWSSFALGCLTWIAQTQLFARRLVDWGSQLSREFRDILFEPLARVGKSEISVFKFFEVLIFIIVIVFLGRASRRVLLNRILRQTPLDLGIQHAIATFTQYIVITFGFLIGLQTAGIDLSALTILAGAVGVGVGLGLQNIANNFISGIIILFERPIKIGDRIEVGAVNGDVVHIAARSTTVRTNDNIAIIIPNSSFISSNVINWSHGDSKVRFRVPVGVAYSSDVRLVERLLLEVAKENENVLENPPAGVRFLEFGDSALEFELRVWSSRLLHRKGLLISQLNFAIYEKFKQHQIEIPFPQHDLHFKADPEVLRQVIHSANSGQASPEREPVARE